MCRLYPLARHVRADRTEWFSLLEGHPESAGKFTGEGTIGEFLEAHGAQPFLAAADDYFYWCCAVHESLGSDPGADPDQSPEDIRMAASFLDMDAAITDHCSPTKTAEPEDLEDRRQLHLRILYGQLTAPKEKERRQCVTV